MSKAVLFLVAWYVVMNVLKVFFFDGSEGRYEDTPYKLDAFKE